MGGFTVVATFVGSGDDVLMGERADRVHRAARLGGIAPFHVMDLLAKAQALEGIGRPVIHLEIGEPDFATPEPIVRAGQIALAQGRTRYTPAAGLPALREAISQFYLQRYGVRVPAARIVVTPGASGALLLALATLTGSQQKVLLTDPGYPCNRHLIEFLDGVPVNVPVEATTQFQLSAALCSEHWDDATVAALVSTPSNPTGTVISDDEMRALIDVARQRNGRLIVDEIYHGLVYDAPPQTALAFSDDVFVVNSFSKYFGMTGWRLGWVVAPEAYVDDVEKLAQNVFLAPSTVAQHAALAAFLPETLDILEQRRHALAQRRDFLVPALRELGFAVPITPSGAFYVYASCPDGVVDSYRYALNALEQCAVAIAPGIDFGRHRAQTHVRFAYTTDIARLTEALERLRAWHHRTA